MKRIKNIHTLQVHPMSSRSWFELLLVFSVIRLWPEACSILHLE